MKKIALIIMIVAQVNIFAEPAVDSSAQQEEKVAVQTQTPATTPDDATKTKEEKAKELAAQVAAQVMTAS